MRYRIRHFSYKAAGAVIAYDARYLTDSDGTALQTWTNLASTSYNATEATLSKRPIVKTGVNGINGQTALSFDGTDDDLQAASVQLNTFVTVIFCGKFTTIKPFFIEQGPNAGSSDGFYFYGSNVNSWQFRRAVVNAGSGVANWAGSNSGIGTLKYNGSGIYRLNGASQSNGTITGSALTNTSITNNINLCSRNRSTAFSDGLLGSLAVYNEALADSMLKRIEKSSAFSFKISCN